MAVRTGYADLPLHGGKAPRWLFVRMVRLAREILVLMSEEFGTGEVLRRLSDPHWFQALGCLLGFDWHSSGLTTTTCGALKEALREVGPEIGLFAAGGKGAVSRRTPEEIAFWAEKEGMEAAPLIYASRMSAKVDSAALQDGFQIYHHAFFFDRAGRWCVVQQGMREETHLARRYHWLSEGLKSFVVEPHQGVVGAQAKLVLNLVAKEAEPAREAIPELAQEKRKRGSSKGCSIIAPSNGEEKRGSPRLAQRWAPPKWSAWAWVRMAAKGLRFRSSAQRQSFRAGPSSKPASKKTTRLSLTMAPRFTPPRKAHTPARSSSISILRSISPYCVQPRSR